MQFTSHSNIFIYECSFMEFFHLLKNITELFEQAIGLIPIDSEMRENKG